MRPAALAILVLLAAGSARGEAVSERPDAVALTIYRDRPASTSDITAAYAQPRGLALIVETRTIEAPAEGGRISFRGVAPGIVPQSARIEGLPTEIVERNFDYDLLSPGSLLAKSINRPVRVIRTDRATGKVTEQAAIVRSAPDGVMLEIDGGIEALHCGGLPERLVFDRIPVGLSDRPTLSVLTKAGAPGRYKVRLSYLATGFDWSADYVASIAPDGRTLDLTGWITLVNRTSASFADAPTQVVAGKWSRAANDGTSDGPIAAMTVALRCWPTGGWTSSPGMAADMLPPPPPPSPMMEGLMVTASRAAPAKMAKVSDLGDYKLYTLPEPTTVAARQTKQVGMIDQRDVPFERVYRFTVDVSDLGDADAPRPATVLLRLQNKAIDHLGLALPAGTVSVREPDADGRMVLAGEDKLDDAPVGLPFEVELGRAMDVSVQVRQLSEKSVGGSRNPRARRELEATVINGKPVSIAFELRHASGDTPVRVKSETVRHTTKGSDPTWKLSIPAGGTRVVRYTVDENDE